MDTTPFADARSSADQGALDVRFYSSGPEVAPSNHCSLRRSVGHFHAISGKRAGRRGPPVLAALEGGKNQNGLPGLARIDARVSASDGSDVGSHQEVCWLVMDRDGLPPPPPFANLSLSQLVRTRMTGIRLTKKGSAAVKKRSPRIARKHHRATRPHSSLLVL